MANDSLRELSIRVLQTQDDERRNIARNLHDSVGQLLAALKMNNALVAAEASKLTTKGAKAVRENDALTDEILKSVRTISHLLHPPLLDEAGLPSALRWYVEEFGERSGISVKLDCPPMLDRLAPELETAIFRIVQESLGNIHRHSGSSTALVHLEVNRDQVFLEIKDEGQGIPVERQREMKMGVRGGVGIRGMQERVTRFGGELNIQSGEHGSTVRAVVPRHPSGLNQKGVA